MDIKTFGILKKYCEKEGLKMVVPIQTNKDLIQSASKEQLVDELFRFWMEVIYHSKFELREEEIEFVKLKIKAWLKQPHHEKE